MAHKSFKRAQNLDPVYFEVGEGEDTVRFDCVDDLPAGVILAFADTMEAEDQGGSNAIQAVKDMFDAAIIDSQREQFWELTKAKANGVTLSMMMEIASWLAEQYTARPTGPSSANGQSGKPSGSASTGGHLREVTTYSKPEPAALGT